MSDGGPRPGGCQRCGAPVLLGAVWCGPCRGGDRHRRRRRGGHRRRGWRESMVVRIACSPVERRVRGGGGSGTRPRSFDAGPDWIDHDVTAVSGGRRNDHARDDRGALATDGRRVQRPAAGQAADVDGSHPDHAGPVPDCAEAARPADLRRRRPTANLDLAPGGQGSTLGIECGERRQDRLRRLRRGRGRNPIRRSACYVPIDALAPSAVAPAPPPGFAARRPTRTQIQVIEVRTGEHVGRARGGIPDWTSTARSIVEMHAKRDGTPRRR